MSEIFRICSYWSIKAKLPSSFFNLLLCGCLKVISLFDANSIILCSWRNKKHSVKLATDWKELCDSLLFIESQWFWYITFLQCLIVHIHLVIYVWHDTVPTWLIWWMIIWHVAVWTTPKPSYTVVRLYAVKGHCSL